MLQRQHSQFNSPCKYTEMKARSQMFFADLSRFHSILLDTSVRRQSSPYYDRACNCTAKQAGSSRWSPPPPEPAYKHSGHWDRMPPADRWAAGQSRDWRRSSAPRGPDPSRLPVGSWHFQATGWRSVFEYLQPDSCRTLSEENREYRPKQRMNVGRMERIGWLERCSGKMSKRPKPFEYKGKKKTRLPRESLWRDGLSP